MKINIKQVSRKEKKGVELWKSREWNKYGKEAGYEWKQKNYMLTARDNKKIIGFALFKIVGGVSYLVELIIAKDYRRKGVGLMLLKKFETISKKRKCHLVYLRTSDRHKTAIPFYIKNGYKKVATLKNFLFHDNWYFFQKNLK